MYSEDDYVMLSGIQHFAFCRRQWALIHIENIWQDNHFTANGEVLHKRVHDENIVDYRNGVISFRGLRVFSNALGCSGTCDLVEFHPALKDGIQLNNKQGMWLPNPVEYKRGSSKVNDCDRLQLTSQVICLEEMFSCHIETGDIFYFENRRREKVEITQELRRCVSEMFEEMHSYMSRGYTPKVKKSKACDNCSLQNECLPEILNKRDSVKTYIKKHIEENNRNEEDA